MSDSTRETLVLLSRVLLRCWIFGFAVLFIWLGAILLMGNVIHDLHGPLFGLTNHELDVIFYCGMGLWKLAVLACFFIPWLSIKQVLKKS
jgi:hypothetical protein